MSAMKGIDATEPMDAMEERKIKVLLRFLRFSTGFVNKIKY